MSPTTITSTSILSNGSKELKSTPPILHAAFNYYSLPTPPKIDDLGILTGTSGDMDSHVLAVTDMRSLPAPISSYTHETHGFQILQQPVPIDTSHSSLHDLAVIRSQYFPTITSLLKTAFNARSAVVVNHTLRDISDFDLTGFDTKKPRAKDSIAPFFTVHSDYTPAGARAHLRAMTSNWFKETGTEEGTTEEERQQFFRLRDEIIAAEDDAMAKAGLEPGNGEVENGKGGHWEWDGRGYEGPRYAMFSIWRPWDTVHRDPLAIMDTTGFDFPYVPLPRRYWRRPGCVEQYYNENVLVQPPAAGQEAAHKWLYLSEQKPEEVYALKFYDSEALRRGDGSVKMMCPHSAFRTEDMKDSPVRRSCELRVWCIW